MIEAPPCTTPGTRPNLCARRHYDQHVMHNVDLPGPWAGWKIRGKWLIGPGGRKITRQQIEERFGRTRNDGAPESGPPNARMANADWHGDNRSRAPDLRRA